MRFFKSFTLLHRKSKSESSATVKVPHRGHAQTRSLSFVSAQHFDEQVLVADNTLFNSIVPTGDIMQTAPIKTLPTASLPTHTLVLEPTTAPYQRIHTLEFESVMLNSAGQVRSSTIENALNHRIRVLESTITQVNLTNQALSDTVSKLQATIEDLQDEIRTNRDHLYDTLQRDTHLRRQAKADDEEIQRLEDQLMQCTKFLGLAIDIGLHEPVLARVQVALRVGEDADEALIDSIREAAERPGSPWARIIPAITGPRTSDNYISAINATLKVRKELKGYKKVAKFWKRAAKESHEHADMVTPSTSKISSIHEVISEERQQAVDELLAKIKSGSRRSGPMLPSVMLTPQSDFVDDVFIASIVPDTPLVVASPSPSPLTIRNCNYPIRNSTSPILDAHVQNSTSTIPGRYVPNLPPLASKSFKEELVASESFKHLSKRTPASHPKVRTRCVLGELDLNRNINAKLIASDSATTQGSKRSAKALSKRRAIVLEESIESIKAAYGLGPLSPSALGVIGDGHQTTRAISISPLLCNKECWQEDGSHELPIGNSAADNSVNTLIDHTTRVEISDYSSNLAANIPVVSEDLENDKTSTSGSASVSSIMKLADREESNTMNVNVDDSEACSTLLPDDFSFIAESITSTPSASPTKNATVTLGHSSPTKPTSPVTLSRLPVFKHFRRLSVSVGLSKGGSVQSTGVKFAEINPLTVKKKSLFDLTVPSTLTKPPTNSTPSNIPTSSRLSTPDKRTSPGSRIANSGRRAARTLSRIMY